LLRYLEKPETPFDRVYRTAWSHLTVWLGNRLPRPVPAARIRFGIVLSLCEMGTAADPAIPDFVRMVKEGKILEGARGTGIEFLVGVLLRHFMREKPEVTATLTDGLTDKDAMVRENAANALLEATFASGDEERAGFRRCLSHPDYSIRSWATNYIGQHPQMRWNETLPFVAPGCFLNTNTPGF